MRIPTHLESLFNTLSLYDRNIRCNKNMANIKSKNSAPPLMASFDEDFHAQNGRSAESTILLRVAKFRTNRSATLPLVNTRLQSFEKDYEKLLKPLCETLCVPMHLLEKMATTIGLGASKLIANGCIEADNFLALFPSEIKYSIGDNSVILDTILRVSQSLQRFSQQATPSLDIVKPLHDVVKCLTKANFLEFDNHATAIISWWLPQFIELLSIILLFSDTEGGQMQTLKDTNALDSYFNCYRANIVYVVYFLTGAYLLEKDVTATVIDLQVDSLKREEDCTKKLDEKSKVITKSIRKRLQYATRNCSDNMKILKKPVMLKEKVTGVRTWKHIYADLPQVCATCVFLFISDIPQLSRKKFGLDVGPPSAERMPVKVSVKPHLHKLLEKIAKIGLTLEKVREFWPIEFTERHHRLLLRVAITIIADTEQIFNLQSVPFAVPESWENWVLFLEMLREFLDYFILLVQRRAPKPLADSVLGKMLVQIRFMAQIKKIEASEDCVLTFP